MTALVGHRSRKRIAAFELLRPTSTAEALDMRGRTADAAFMAGGIDLLNRLKYGEPIERVVHLGRLPGFAEIAATLDGLRIGAGTTHQALHDSALLRERCPALAEAWGGIANFRVRAKGTIGGNVMARASAYDLLPAVMALGGRLVAADAGGASRLLPADQAEAISGLLLAIELPGAQSTALLVDRSLRPALSVFLGLDREGGLVTAGRVAVGCAYARPLLRTLSFAPAPSRAVAADASAIAVAVAAEFPPPLSDGNGSAAYRHRMIAVLVRRLLERAGEAP
jgi:carbon-monoxide dehydrogenase medium subunit